MNAPNTVATIEVVCSMSMYYQCLKGKKKEKKMCSERKSRAMMTMMEKEGFITKKAYLY